MNAAADSAPLALNRVRRASHRSKVGCPWPPVEPSLAGPHTPRGRRDTDPSAGEAPEGFPERAALPVPGRRTERPGRSTPSTTAPRLGSLRSGATTGASAEWRVLDSRSTYTYGRAWHLNLTAAHRKDRESRPP